jgi:hypothetical protein
VRWRSIGGIYERVSRDGTDDRILEAEILKLVSVIHILEAGN